MVIPLLIVLASSLLSQEPLPAIMIKSWTSSDELNFDSASPLPVLYGNTSSTVFAIPSTVGGVTLFCNASYPVEWNFHHHQLGSFGAPVRGRSRGVALVSSTRQSKDIFNTSEFVFQTELKILGSSNIMTGNYSCQRVDSPEVSSSIYIYWEGSSPPFLTLATMNMSVYWNNQTRQVVLPCKVSRPDVPVDLYQITHNDSFIISMNSSVSYDASRGFIFTDLPNPIGQFKCVANSEPDKDFLVVHVLPDSNVQAQEEVSQRMLRPASFSFNADKFQFICCSSKGKPPRMAHYYCEHPISCQLRKDSLIDVENSGRRIDDRCAAIRVYMATSGVLRCIGDGIDIVKTYVFPINTGSPFWRQPGVNKTISQPYYSWDEINADKMIDIRSSASQEIYYATQNYTFSCSFSTAYFSHGVRWMISWKNKTSVLLQEAVFNETGVLGFRQIIRKNMASVIVTADMNLDSIICFAPVWNTTEWRNKSLTVTVQEPLLPSIPGSEVEVIEWFLNDTNKILICNFTGKPTPVVNWKKDNKTFNNIAKTDNTSSTIEFARVSHETHGVYVCSVRNFQGSSNKTFRVLVSDNGSSGVTIFVIFIVIGFFLVLFGSGLLAWKLYKQKRIITHLAGAVFKDVNDHGRAEQVSTGATGININEHFDSERTGNGLRPPEGSKYDDGNYHKL